MPRHNITPNQIDALLPQTQCKDCGYEGCRPYAEAIIYKSETIDRCLPGGTETLTKLGELLAQDVSPFMDEMKQKAKPKQLAIIREAECIGCTKCITACPVDAILGTSKEMHTVINAECTGCELCVEPCPMDCIDMLVAKDQAYDGEHARQRYYARLDRLHREKSQNKQKHLAAIQLDQQSQEEALAAKKAAIAAAVARVKSKKKS